LAYTADPLVLRLASRPPMLRKPAAPKVIISGFERFRYHPISRCSIVTFRPIWSSSTGARRAGQAPWPPVRSVG